MQKEKVDLVHQQVEQKPPPNEDIRPLPPPHLSASSQVSQSGIIEYQQDEIESIAIRSAPTVVN